jgi:hypothetical protein
MVHKLVKNDLTTFPPYNEPILACLKDDVNYYYVVKREEFINYDYNSVRDVFKEALGEQFTYWEIDEIDSWMDFEDLTKLWKANTPKVSNVVKYKQLMERYHNGEFGSTPLTLAEILNISKEYTLLEDMSCEEVEELLKESTGMTKMMFSHILELKKQGLY